MSVENKNENYLQNKYHDLNCVKSNNIKKSV